MTGKYVIFDKEFGLLSGYVLNADQLGIMSLSSLTNDLLKI